MKLTKITSMMAAVATAGFCMSAVAGEGQSGKLELDNPATNVNVTATALTGGGTWNTTPAVESSYIVIDCDAASSNQFNATTATTGKVVKCTFTLQAAPVPVPLSNPDSNTQVAFCIATNTTSGGAATFQAYVNNSWTTLTGANIPATDSEYTLTITFDYSGTTKYAKFTIGNTDLEVPGGDTWFPTSKSGSTGVSQYCFIGEGGVKSFLTTDQNIAAEEEQITIGGNPVTIGIPEDVVQTIGGGSSSAAATELAKTGTNGQLQLDNYVIYGLNSNNEIKNEAKPVAKAATATTGGGIKLDFTNVAANQVTGTTIKYTLLGKEKSTDTGWTTVVSETTNKDAMVIPSGTSCRIFKVQVTVDKN